MLNSNSHNSPHYFKNDCFSETGIVILDARMHSSFTLFNKKTTFVLFDRRHYLVILALTCIYFAIAVWMVLPPVAPGFYWDDSWYLMMAEWFSGRSDHRQLAWTMLHERQYPPLFPLVLSLVGEPLLDPGAALIMNASFYALAAAVTLAWLVQEGLSISAAGFAAILVIFNPFALSLLPFLMSEHLFALLTSIALALTCLTDKSRALWLLIGLVAGRSVATRGMGWVLVLAFLHCLVIQRNFRALLMFMPGLFVSLLLISYLRSSLPESPDYLDIFAASFEQLGEGYALNQIRQMGSAWFELWGSPVAAGLAAVVVIPGIFIRMAKNRIDAWYAFFSFFVILAWPYPGQMTRFLCVLMPSFLLAIHSLLMWVKSEKYRPVLALSFISLLVFSTAPTGLGRSIQRLVHPPPAELFSLSRTREWTRAADRDKAIVTLTLMNQLLQDTRKISQTLSDDACIYSELPALVSVHTLRASYSPDWESDKDIDLARLRCSYYYLLPSRWSNRDGLQLESFVSTHREIFRSFSPDKNADYPVLGVFLELRNHLPASTEADHKRK